MDFGVNPLTQFHAAPAVSYEGNLQAPYASPSTYIPEATPCGFFKDFDQQPKDKQVELFKGMMDMLKNYVDENKPMEDYFKMHDGYLEDFTENTAFSQEEGATTMEQEGQGSRELTSTQLVGDMVNAETLNQEISQGKQSNHFL